VISYGLNSNIQYNHIIFMSGKRWRNS